MALRPPCFWFTSASAIIMQQYRMQKHLAIIKIRKFKTLLLTFTCTFRRQVAIWSGLSDCGITKIQSCEFTVLMHQHATLIFTTTVLCSPFRPWWIHVRTTGTCWVEQLMRLARNAKNVQMAPNPGPSPWLPRIRHILLWLAVIIHHQLKYQYLIQKLFAQSRAKLIKQIRLCNPFLRSLNLSRDLPVVSFWPAPPLQTSKHLSAFRSFALRLP